MSDAGARILIVEDEAMIGLLLEDFLDILGYGIAGSCVSVAECERLLESANGLDGAILDRNLLDGPVWPVARRLQALGVPFVLASGDDGGGIPEDIVAAPRLTKPYTLETLQGALSAMLTRA